MPRANSFRYNARWAYLTYSQVADVLEHDDLADHLITQFEALGATQSLACFERHEDGGLHVHALLHAQRRFDTVASNFFDVDFTGEGDFYHPNIQRSAFTVKDLTRISAYVRKDDDVFVDTISLPSATRSRDEVVSEALGAESLDDFMEVVRVGMPYQYMTSFSNVRSCATYHFPPPNPNSFDSPYSHDDFWVLPEMDNYRRRYLMPESEVGDRPLSLIVIGPSRLGKTAWARCLGTHAYLKGLFSVDPLKSPYDYLVLDDIDLRFLPSYKELLGGQRDITLTDKYRGKTRVPHGKPCIVLTNDPLPFDKLNREWIESNCIIVEIDTKLYVDPNDYLIAQ